MAYSESERCVKTASLSGVSGLRSFEKLTYFHAQPRSVSFMRVANQSPVDMAKKRTQYCRRGS